MESSQAPALSRKLNGDPAEDELNQGVMGSQGDLSNSTTSSSISQPPMIPSLCNPISHGHVRGNYDTVSRLVDVEPVFITSYTQPETADQVEGNEPGTAGSDKHA